jgi:uncharacterized protein
VKFEYDPAKDQANIDKHGISLAFAEAFDFSDDVAWIVEDARRDYREARYVAMSFISDALYVLVFTPRAGGIRVISLRRANEREERRYEQKD